MIGNTHFDKGKGTFFSESFFVTTIKTPNAKVILLDELSSTIIQMAWNILMIVLDGGQRYLRLDGRRFTNRGCGEGVTFIVCTNIGNEYTSTRVMDRVILDRFVTIEMDVLDDVQELGLLKFMFPEVNDDDLKDF